MDDYFIDATKDMMKAMMQFFLDRKEELNLVHVASLGDMTDDLVVDAFEHEPIVIYDLVNIFRGHFELTTFGVVLTLQGGCTVLI